MLRASWLFPGRLSVRFTVTLLYCIKTVLELGSQNLHYAAPRTLSWRNSVPLGKGGSRRTKAWKVVPPLKKVLVVPLLARVAWKRWQTGTDMLLIITSTHHGELFSCINIDDFEWFWTPKISGFSEFSRFRTATHILRVNCAEMARDNKPRQPACEILGIKLTF